jgi:mono/diheme cytochrome c family protein
VTRRSTGLLVCLSSIVVLLFATAYSAPAPSGKIIVSPAQAREDQIRFGRQLVLTHDCGGCHGMAGANPLAPGYLDGVRDTAQQFHIGPFITRPKNLTPDVATGTGSFTERQLFNALRYGLRPEETPDVQITSMVPGQGNFPLHPHYLAPPMPWTAWRYMSDPELMAIAAYLKNGLKPVRNKVADSDGPPDFWASEYTVEKIGPYPVAPFPTVNEKAP